MQKFFELLGISYTDAVKEFIETAVSMVMIFLAVVFIRYTIITPFLVHGSSMEPTMHSGDLILVNKVGYNSILGFDMNKAKRGDVVVVRPPDNVNTFYIKRIVGLPGETIEVQSSSVLIYNDEYINGVTLDEEYLDFSKISGRNIKQQQHVLKDNQYFVMGDNRNASRDSRNFGPIHHSNIVGKMAIVLFPFEDFGLYSVPDYNF
jgi:signal peptidase I